MVLVSGGVGQSPLLSMLEYLAGSESDRGIVWVHGARNRKVSRSRPWKSSMASSKSTFSTIPWKDMQVEGGCYKGVAELDRLKEDAVLQDMEYYICGPAPFIKKQYDYLTKMGIRKEAIKYEEFGPKNLTLS